MDFKPLRVGQAAGLLLLFALPVRAANLLDTHLLAIVGAASQLAQPLDVEPVPGRPSRDDDAAAELGAEPDDVADDVEDDEAAAAEDEVVEDDEPATLLGEQWHQLGPISAECFYTGEVFNNARGGIRTRGATRYRGNLDLGLRLDAEQAQWWDGGEFYAYMQQSHGTTLRPDFVGDGQYYSNIDTGPKPQSLTQLGEYWYQHSWGDDVFLVRLGRQDPNNDFAYADLGSDFINSSFVTLPNIPMPYWPFQTLGVTSLFQPYEKLRLGGGAYDQGRDVAQWWATTTTRGMFFIAQADYLPFADREDAPLTIFRGGAWYSSSDTLAVDASRVFPDNYGFYVTVDRMLFPEADSTGQGLGAFIQFSWAPTDRNPVDVSLGAGLLYTGLLTGHDADTCGVGFTRIEFSPSLRDTTGQVAEGATEIFYKARPLAWLAIIPDLQYITSPFGLYRDAMVVGVRCEVNL